MACKTLISSKIAISFKFGQSKKEVILLKIFKKAYHNLLHSALILQLFIKDSNFINNFKEFMSELFHSFIIFYFESFKLSF